MIRDNRFDNIKALLIFLVVFGHAIEYLFGTKGAYGAVRALIYSFHMPAFVFISGYFAQKSKSSLPDVTVKYLSTYLIFNTLFALSPWHVNSPQNFLYPQLIYWYLLCMCFWRISAPTIAKIRFAIPLSILFTLYIGTCKSADRFMSISRAICFFTFYLIGYKFSLKWLEKINKWILRIALFACFMLTLLVYYKGLIPVKMYEYIQSYASTEVADFDGIVMRVFMMLVALVITISLIGLMPSKKYGFTVLGRNSLCIYLLHIYIIKAISSLNIISLGNSLMNIAFCFILSVFICLFLSIPAISGIYDKVSNRLVRAFV